MIEVQGKLSALLGELASDSATNPAGEASAELDALREMVATCPQG